MGRSSDALRDEFVSRAVRRSADKSRVQRPRRAGGCQSKWTDVTIPSMATLYDCQSFNGCSRPLLIFHLSHA